MSQNGILQLDKISLIFEVDNLMIICKEFKSENKE